MLQTISYPSCDGVHTIHAVQWLPEGEPRGVIQIVHGVAEYVERYAPLAHYLAERGYVVCGEDHLGHGHTAAGQFGYFAPRAGGTWWPGTSASSGCSRGSATPACPM